MKPSRRARRAFFALVTSLLLACHAQRPAVEPSAAEIASAETAPAAPAPSAVERLIALARSDNRVQDHLEHLCVDIGPRLTGSTNLQVACEWARDRFEEYGLSASLEKWGDFAVGFDRGPWSGGMVAPVEVDFEFHTMSWTAGTNGPKRGPVLAYPASEEELAALGDRLAGAWVVRPPGNELKSSSGEIVFEKPAQPSRSLIERVQAEIVARGALGEVRGSRGALLVTGGDHRIEWSDLPQLVSIRVHKDQHDALWTRMQAGEAVELEFDVDNRFVQGPVPQYNVVADLVGREKPDEYVIVGGHLDSWDGAQGAIDNGTGCATALEAARLLAAAGIEPRRTIRFMLWTGEEQGLLGSEAWIEQHPELLPRISAVFNHDEGTNYLSGLGAPAAMMPALRTALAPLAGLDPAYPFELEEIEGLPSFIGSDHDAFVRVGVPGFFWRQSGRSEYEHYHHTQHDNFDAAIPEYQRHSALVVALTAFGVAELPELLDRTNMKAPEPRRMGVQLDGTKLTQVMDDGRAKAAGMQAGDVILAIDGVEMRSQGTITGALRSGASTKVLKVRRGEETLEITLDWSQDPDEPRRLEAIQKREERDAARDAEREARRAAGAAPESPR